MLRRDDRDGASVILFANREPARTQAPAGTRTRKSLRCRNQSVLTLAWMVIASRRDVVAAVERAIGSKTSEGPSAAECSGEERFGFGGTGGPFDDRSTALEDGDLKSIDLSSHKVCVASHFTDRCQAFCEGFKRLRL